MRRVADGGRAALVLGCACVMACHDDADARRDAATIDTSVAGETSVTPDAIVASDTGDVSAPTDVVDARDTDDDASDTEASPEVLEVEAGASDVEPDADVEPGADASSDADTEPDPVAGAAFFAIDVLHRIDVVVAPQWLETLDDDTSVRVPCDVSYDGVTVASAGCRKKGQSTLRPLSDKPSLSIKLDEYVAGADIDGVERFNVHNTVMDPTFTSEPLTYLLYERAGIPAPRTAHAVLTFNGETKGFYVVVEAVNKRFLRQRFGDGGGNLYEGPWDFDRSVDDLELKDVEEGRSRDDMRQLQAAIMGVDDDLLVASVTPHLDVDQALRTFAVDMAFCLWDGYTIAAWNFYFYHVPGGRFVIVPHGADWPLYRADVDPFDADFRPWGEQYPPGLLAVRLMAALPEAYRTSLADVTAGAFDVLALHARIDTIVQLLAAVDGDEETLAWERFEAMAHMDEPRGFVVDRKAFLEEALAE